MTSLDINELFVPATADDWKQQLLDNATLLELKTTSWQSGGMARTILAIMSNMFAQGDGIISIMAQGGFLDFAATGQVTYVAANGQQVTQKVTPDPSITGENPEGTPGWLDVLASSVYDQDRIGAQYASNAEVFANTTSNSYGPYAPGTYHITNPTSGAGYSNVSNFTIAPANIVGTAITAATNTTPIVITTSGAHGLGGTEFVYVSGVIGNTAANGFWSITVISATTIQLNGSIGNGSWTSGGTVNVCTSGDFKADIAGPSSTSATGTITQIVTTLTGVSCYNLQSFIGALWESNVALADRCRLKLQSLSPNGPKGAYSYFALSAAIILADYDPPVSLSAPITRTLVQTSATTGIITTVVANAAGAVSGVSNLGVTGATNASPIEITSASAHGLATGNFATISGVIGNTAANSTWVITVTGASTFTLDGSTGSAAYASGGTIQGGDIGQVDRVIQASCVPDDITSFTVSSTGFDVAIAAAVDVPQENLAIYTAAVQISLALYFASLPIGGNNGEIDIDIIIGVLYSAGQIGTQRSYVKRITSLTLNAVAANLAYPGGTYVAQLSPTPVITITGV